MKEMIKYGAILGLICFLASGLLAVVNGITAPQIKLQKENAESLALKEVMPGIAVFKPQYKGEALAYYLAYDEINKLKGFVIKAEGKGYSSTIEVLAGLGLNLDITSIKVLSQSETPGLGARVSESSFQEQFKGRNLDSLDQVEAITGATISSTAVINSLKSKIGELKEELLKEINNAG